MSTQATVFAVNESAAEACASKCTPADADAKLFTAEEPRDVKTKQEYDACYSKCVAQETKEVVEEREKVSPSAMAGCCTSSLVLPCQGAAWCQRQEVRHSDPYHDKKLAPVHLKDDHGPDSSVGVASVMHEVWVAYGTQRSTLVTMQCLWQSSCICILQCLFATACPQRLVGTWHQLEHL